MKKIHFPFKKTIFLLSVLLFLIRNLSAADLARTIFHQPLTSRKLPTLNSTSSKISRSTSLPIHPSDFQQLPRTFMQGPVTSNVSRFKFELANKNDCEELFDIFEDIKNNHPDDATKLVIFPPQSRRKILNHLISLERIWVVRDMGENADERKDGNIDNPGEIISFVKLYPITNQSDLEEILSQEIKPKMPWQQTAVPIEQKIYDFPDSIINYRYFENIAYLIEHPSACTSPQCQTPQPESPFPEQSYHSIDGSRCYIYYGMAFTKRKYRGKGFNFLLQLAALSKILPMLVEYILTHQNSEVCYTFGQVVKSTGPLRAFATFAKALKIALNQRDDSSIKIHYAGYSTFKPYFTENEFGRLMKCSFADPRSVPGVGRIFSFKLPYPLYNPPLEGSFLDYQTP